LIDAAKNPRALVVVLLTLAVALSSLPAAAQEPAEATKAQMALGDKAIDAASRSDYGAARDYFEQSLALGELNIVLVNLGNIYFKLGDCTKALDALERSSLAPKVSWPTPVEVENLKARYLKDLSGECPGTLAVTCDGSSAELFIDESGPHQCNGEFELPPGHYNVVLKGVDRKIESKILVASFKTSKLTLVLPDVATPVVPNKPTPVVVLALPPPIEPPPLTTVQASAGPPFEAYAWLVGGVLVGVAGVGLDTLPDTATNREFDGLDLAPVGFYLGASVLVGYGFLTLFR